MFAKIHLQAFLIIIIALLLNLYLLPEDWMRVLGKFFKTQFLSRRQNLDLAARTMASSTVRYLGQEEAIQLDQDLFNEYKFSLEQLMELAGLSVATAAFRVYGESHKTARILAVAGPGNNGGDAMVAVRHMKLFGFENVTLLNTRPPTKSFFQALVSQADQTGVRVANDPTPFLTDQKPALVIDGLFGFSFKPPIRPDMKPFLQILASAPTILSIDIPSGWDVENGPPSEPESDPSLVLTPHTLVSLSSPKKCASFLPVGTLHFLGGRFLPPQLDKKYSLNLPPYPGTDCILQL